MPTTYKLIRGDSVLVAQPLLIQHYGRVGALLIQQIHYWSQKGQGVVHGNQRWIHNTAEQWAEQICVSASTIKRAVKKLIRDGIIQVQKLSKHKSNQTNSYTLNHERLMDLVGDKDMSDQKHKKECAYEKMDNTSENRTKAHRFKMTSSSDQSDPMVIQKITNKNKPNKSEDCVHQYIQPLVKSEGEVPNVSSATSVDLLQNKGITSPTGAGHDGGVGSDRSGEGKNQKIGTTAQDMVDIWNKEISLNKKTTIIKLNREISKYLVASYKYKFNEDLSAWKDYCRLITSSPYLMGQDFALSITWALKFSTIDRILTGELGVKLQSAFVERERPKSLEEAQAEALAHIDGVVESQGCKNARHAILKALGPIHYNSWFTWVDITDNGVTLKPHNRFVEDAIRTRFGDVLDGVGR